MAKRAPSVRLATAAACAAFAFALAAACGEGASSSETDAGAQGDGSIRGDPDAMSVDGATCELGADFTTSIADASLADGATSTGICVGCMNAHCRKELAACADDCYCQGIAVKGLACLTSDGADPSVLNGCVARFALVPPTSRALGLALLGCLEASCALECTGPPVDGGNDALADAAGD